MIGFFSEKLGMLSMGRLLSFMCVAGAILLGLVQIIMHGDANETLVIGLAATGIAGKAHNKLSELKHKNTQ